MSKIKNVAGKRFGKLTAIKKAYTKSGRTYWECKCDCGNNIDVILSSLTTGHTLSCGCYQKQRTSEVSIKHGMRHSQIYKAWCNMKRRCYDKNSNRYYAYGARGITVCDKWMSFDGFYQDMGESYKEELTLDRINYDGNYCKENCRWADKFQQANNKSNNHLLTYHGETDTMMNMSKRYNITYGTLKHRIQRGWDVDKALTTPQRNIKKSKVS